jgi:hypothetical protein
MQVYVTGSVENEPDIHDRIITCLDKTNTDIEQRDFPPLSFKVVLQEHRYLVKQPSKDTAALEGILKFNTLQKHHDLLPSVVLLLSTFCVDWQQNEWLGRENSIADYVANVRAMLNSRDVKIVVVLVKTGAGGMDKELIDERILGFRRRLALDGRTFAFISPFEISPTNASMRRLSKTTRELSSMYYVALERRARGQIRNAPQRAPFDGLLIGRYSFKLALFLEFQGLQSQAVKYYKQSFHALADTMFKTDETFIDQLKAVAEYSHFRMCLLLLRVGALKDAVAQFKMLISTFANSYSGTLWRHDSWLSDQYRVFLQLLDAFQVPEADIVQEDLDRSFFLRNAARFEMRRHESFNCVISGISRDVYAQRLHILQNLVVLTPKYVGATPTLVKPNLEQAATTTSDDESAEWAKWYMEEVERSFDHDAVIMDLLTRAINLIPDGHGRRRAMAGAMIAEQYIRVGRLDLGISCVDTPIQLLCEEGWIAAAVPLLRRKLSCALELCRPKEYLDAALLLYAIAAESHLDRYEKEQLHRNIMLLIRPTTSEVASLGEMFSPAATPLQRNLVISFAEAAAQASHNHDHSHSGEADGAPSLAALVKGINDLPSNYTVDLGGFARMIDISSSFSATSVEVGDSVTVTLTFRSKFQCELAADEIYVRFTGGVLTKKIVHPMNRHNHHDVNGSGDVVVNNSPEDTLTVRTGHEPCCAHMTSRGIAKAAFMTAATTSTAAGIEPVCEACLTIPAAGTPLTISFQITITEDAYNSLSPTDPSICVERVQVVIRNPSIAIDAPDASTPVSDSVSSSGSPTTPSSDVAAASTDDSTSQDVRGPKPQDHLAQRTIVLDVSATSLQFQNCLRDRQAVVAANAAGFSTAAVPKPVPSLKDTCAFLGPELSPAVLQILRPRALIEMISPTVKVLTSAPVGASAVVPPLTVQADVQLLQGPLQRLDVVFKAGANHVLRGRVYLSSDYVPADTPSALFWYPNVETMTAADISNGGNTELTSAFLDSAPFHPFHLSSSNQPSQPILLGDHAPDSVFSIPLFLRSEQQRVCRIRLCMEFIPQKGLESAVMKDFDIVVSFERPLQMNFGLSSMKEAQCGVLREGVPSTVLRGDVISVTTSLTCLGLRSGAIRVLNMSFSHSNDDEEEQVGDQTQILQSKKLFVLEGNKNSSSAPWTQRKRFSSQQRSAKITTTVLVAVVTVVVCASEGTKCS